MNAPAARRGAWGAGPPAPPSPTAVAMGPGAVRGTWGEARTSLRHGRRCRRGPGGEGRAIGWGYIYMYIYIHILGIPKRRVEDKTPIYVTKVASN